MTNPLLTPLALGPLTLPNRVIMSPMTRSRAEQPGDVPTELAARYYAQRASAGLIISEATQVDPRGKGYAFTPGIHSDEQVAGWQRVTEAVHANGGRISLQLWHVGRMSHVDFHDGEAPLAPSAINADAKIYLGGANPFASTSTPRALEIEEIPKIVEQFRRGAELAKRAGFDGVELHGANGYLPHQFLSDQANKRSDRYGGSVTNRIRFSVEVLEAITEVWGGERVGLRISPVLAPNGCGESDPHELYGALIGEANRLGIGFLDVLEYFGPSDKRPAAPTELQSKLRSSFTGRYLANGGFDPASARARLESGTADGIVFARLFLANPDLPERIRRNAALNVPDGSTFYGGDAKGYTDYPALSWTD
jgi:N-ethylmaleimide reductase